MQSYLEHSRRRICNAVNVDFLADIATQTKATKLAASRFEEYSPQYLLYIWANSQSKKQQILSKTEKHGLCHSNILRTIADSLVPRWWTVSTRSCWILRKSSLSGRIGTGIWLGEKVRSGRLWSSDPVVISVSGLRYREKKERKSSKRIYKFAWCYLFISFVNVYDLPSNKLLTINTKFKKLKQGADRCSLLFVKNILFV